MTENQTLPVKMARRTTHYGTYGSRYLPLRNSGGYSGDEAHS